MKKQPKPKIIYTSEMINVLQNMNRFLEELAQLGLPAVKELMQKYGIIPSPEVEVKGDPV